MALKVANNVNTPLNVYRSLYPATNDDSQRNNYFSMLAEEDDDDFTVWMSNKCSTKEIEDSTITTLDKNGAEHNLQQRPNTAPIIHPTRLQGEVQYAISDSGATGHFLLQGATVVNKRLT